ncbi:putative inactive dehydrogenase EasA [Grifola frondosa]|uniref:Putative inactive dehydrogenase EasA n=1 Tax=Grifola frondosa TaxID=5627 RepID=A0A1C7M6W7_GRIFR|nr:putative inactive dehydrogenase EasA [Grifola frondosa]
MTRVACTGGMNPAYSDSFPSYSTPYVSAKSLSAIASCLHPSRDNAQIQRTVPGSLLISEGPFIAAQAGGMPHVPGIWNDEQVAAWRRVTDAVHAKGSFIFMQLWAVGRAATVSQLKKEDPNFPYVGPSDIKLSGRSETPRPLTVTEIKEYVQLYATAASNAVHRAGFDGVEFHGANGYLVDQFLQDVSNNRTDEYGGSVENRCRFALEALEAISKAVGQSRTAVRLSPWGEFQDMRMADATIFSTYTHFITRLSELYPNLAYVHVIEPDAQGSAGRSPRKGESNEFIRKIWAPRPIISAGGYSRESALKVAEETGQLIAFGRAYIPNPDLPLRLRKNLPLTATDRSVFYGCKGVMNRGDLERI